MKQIFLKFLLILSVFSLTTPQVSAGMPVTDIGNTIQDAVIAAKDAVVQGKGIVFDALSLSEETITAVNSASDFINNWVTGPINDGLRIASLVKSGKMIQTVVLASLDDENKLLVSDPQKYLTNQGKKALGENLDTLDEAKGIYKDSLAEYLVTK